MPSYSFRGATFRLNDLGSVEVGLECPGPFSGCVLAASKQIKLFASSVFPKNLPCQPSQLNFLVSRRLTLCSSSSFGEAGSSNLGSFGRAGCGKRKLTASSVSLDKCIKRGCFKFFRMRKGDLFSLAIRCRNLLLSNRCCNQSTAGSGLVQLAVPELESRLLTFG
jgi:hypothetical protein